MKEKKLIELGLPVEQIEEMKRQKVILSPIDEECYIQSDILKYSLIPVDKIRGISARGQAEGSWWDHYIGNCGSVYNGRLKTLNENLIKSGLDTFKSSFTLEEYAYETVACYYEDEGLYYVAEGNHRTTMAKIVGAATMMIEEVTVYKKDQEQTKLYLQVEELKKSTNKLMELMNFRYVKGSIYWNDRFVFSSSEHSVLGRSIERKRIIDINDLVNLNELLNDFHHHAYIARKEHRKKENSPLYKRWSALKGSVSSKEHHPCFVIATSLINEGWTFKTVDSK